jgi:hypothetical protein
MKKLLLATLLANLVLGFMHAAGAAEPPTPAYLQPEVLQAALAIQLNDEQKPQFQKALTDFHNARMEGISLLMRRNNQTDLPRKIKSKTNSLLKKMDKDMAVFLSEEQMLAYMDYRKKLKSNMQGM